MALAVTSIALAGCGGGASAGNTGVTPPNATVAATVPPSPGGTTPVPVTLRYVIPAGIKNAASALGTQNAGRRLQYISTSNVNITITVTPVGGGPAVYGPAPCTTGSCTINFTANPGPNVIAFSLMDGAAHVLSQFTTTQIVQPAIANTFNLTANPVVNSVTLTLAAAPIPYGGTPVDIPLTVNALDRDGNTIVGSANYVDVNGNPLALTLSTTNVQAGGLGTVTIKGPPRITAANQAAIVAHYDGKWLDHTAINVASNHPLGGGLTGTTVTVTPKAIEYTAGLTAGNGLHGVITGPDGNLWAAEYSVGKIAKMSANGTVLNEYAAGTTPQFFAITADGAMLFTDTNVSKIGRITTSGAVTEVASPELQPVDITAGPDGNVWIGSNISSSIMQVTPQGAINLVSIAPLSSARGVGAGPDGNIWVINDNSAKVVAVNAQGPVFSLTYPGATATFNDGIVTGPDGNMYFIEASTQAIGKITFPGHAITPYSAGITAGAQMRQITVGPDGNMWFTEEGNDRIGRITPGGTITEFTTGFSAGSKPIGICIGPDGNLWIGEFGKSAVAKFTY